MTMTQTKRTLTPVGNRVLLQRKEAEETLKGGIILPDSAKEKQELARVIAVGSGKTLKNGETLPLPVAVGDTVLLDKYSGQEISLDGEDYVIVNADDIVALVKEA